MTYFINHKDICICERLMIYLVPRQCCLEGGPWIGSLHLKPADFSVSSSSTTHRMVVATDRCDGKEQCHKVNLKSLNFITYKFCYFNFPHFLGGLEHLVCPNSTAEDQGPTEHS